MAGVLRVFGGSFELAAGGFVVLGATFGGQSSALADRQLLASTDRQFDILSRQLWYLGLSSMPR